MIRVEVSEAGQAPLPAIDVDGAFAIGSGAAVRIRLPAAAARDRHVEIAGGAWRAIAEVRVDGAASAGGPIGDGVTLEVGSYHVRLVPAPMGAVAAPARRTESLARELVRSLLGDGAAPRLVVERGPNAGAERALAPPESSLVIGRGDEAGWVILDADLSKHHAEVRRGWDGMHILDLDSKNGTRVDGVAVREADLHDGALIELGSVALRFRDPAERHLGGRAASASHVVPARVPRNSAIFYVAVTIIALSLVALVFLALGT